MSQGTLQLQLTDLDIAFRQVIRGNSVVMLEALERIGREK